MGERIRIAVAGASGRMGQNLIAAVDADDDLALSAASERSGHDWIGRDLGEAMGGAARGVTVFEDAGDAFQAADVMLDFTAPAATVDHARVAADFGKALVIGTTGLGEDDLAAIAAAGGSSPIVRAGNMSLGVNLLTALTRRVAASLGPEFDVEIVEMHHRHKVDAPSGTALMLGEAAAAGRGIDLGENRESGRDGITGARAPGAIGFSALRGGDVIGEHDVIFAGAGERIVLRHIASDRSLFSSGALRAAKWAHGRTPGLYSMMDVLGL